MRVFVTGGSGFIGTNLVASLHEEGHEVRNYDIESPPSDALVNLWQAGDIMDAAAVRRSMTEFRPDWVVHLAARTDCDEDTTVEAGYCVNTDGTSHLLDAVGACASVQRLVVTSSQFVCGPGRQARGDDDYSPHTVYGHSKVETERRTRDADLACPWVIVRPVNIWGPYHLRYAREFWRVAAKGLYLHPDVPAPTRTYGYVGNVVWQIKGLLEAPVERIDGQVFYVGDHPGPIDEWTFAFCRALRGKDPPRVPFWVLKGLARLGDAISIVIRRPFLITSSRLHSMTVDYVSPIDRTERLLGAAPYDLDTGVAETVRWLRSGS